MTTQVPSLTSYEPDATDYPRPFLPEKLEPFRTAPLPYSAPVPGTPVITGQTPPFRHPDFVQRDLIVTPDDDPSLTTTFHLLKRSRDKWPNRPAMATRKVVNTREIEKAGGKQWTIWELGDYEYLTFSELYEEILLLGNGFCALGVARGENEPEGKRVEQRVGLFMQTCAKWMQTYFAAASQALAIVTAYDTLGAKALGHSLRETNSTILVTEGRLLDVLLIEGVLEMLIGTLKNVVYTTEYGRPANLEESIERIQKKSGGTIDFLSWDEFRKLGKQEQIRGEERRLPVPDDYACIMYTSGSTGPPKGVLLKHKMIIAGLSAAIHMVGKWLTPQDRFLAYLPLAHIVEFELEHASLFCGACLGYGRPQTLTPAAGSLEKGCRGDIEEFQPTIMAGVPQVWETIKKGITRKIDSSGYLTKTLFDSALAFRMWAYGGQGIEDPIPPSNALTKFAVSVIDAIVFDQIRSALGGHLRAGVSGAAKLNRTTSEWLTHILGVPMIKGYAMTETTALLALMPPDQFSTMSEGQIAPSAEIKLVSYPDAGYSVLDEPNPRGEIWVRGNCVSDGYFIPASGIQEDIESIMEQNHEAFQVDPQDGKMWFRTGDIGEIELFPLTSLSKHSISDPAVFTYGGDPNRNWTPFSKYSGHLRIIDRKKNLLKTSRGEYVAIEKLEAIYRSAPAVSNIVVFVRDDKPKPVALIHAVEAHVRRVIVPKLQVSREEEETMSLEDLVRIPGVKKEVLKEVQTAGRESGLSGTEIVEDIVLVGGEEWRVEDGLITSARKVVRREVERRFRMELEAVWDGVDRR